MSDGIIRMCREHDMELRQLGAHLACPFGHTCDTEWYVKPPTAKPGPSLPAPVVHLTAPREDTPAIEPKPRTRRKSDMRRAKVEHPHGTRQRYWAGCKCQPCKDALAKYQRDKKQGRGPASPAGADAKRGVARALPARRGRVVQAVVVPATAHELGRLASAIVGLRDQLSAAEADFRSRANSLFPDWKFVPSSGEAR